LPDGQKSGIRDVLVEFFGGGESRFFFVAAKLTIKQERFARKYVALGCAAEAYRKVYKTSGWTDNAIRVEAHRKLSVPNVALMVEKVKAEQSDFQAITFEEIAAGLRRAAEGATVAGQHSAAAQSLVALGKLAGLYVEKQKVSVDDAREHLDAVQTLADEPDEDEADQAADQKVVNFR
jgi:phage terminase small subunit